MGYSVIIIIGAPRSGTNMLRDILVKLPGVGTWPCDEINYIWRHGNMWYPSDELPAEMANDTVKKYVNDQVELLAEKLELDTVIEKTCANSLRVGFVDKVIPTAKYIYIVRDGMDVVGSALKRWRAKIDFKYIIKKARYVPFSDVPYYAYKFITNRFFQMFSGEKRLAFWGPVMNNTTELLKKHTLLEVCAMQWKACVDNAEHDLKRIPDERKIFIKYEDFVNNPIGEYKRLANFIGKPTTSEIEHEVQSMVKSGSVGKGRSELSIDEQKNVHELICEQLDKYGYG